MKKIIAFGATLLLGILSLIFVTAPAEAAVAPPSGLRITGTYTNKLHTEWSRVSKAQQYQVYANGIYRESSSDTRETVYNLQPCTKYYVQLKVKVNNAWSPLATGSGSATVTTLGCGASTAPAPSTAPTTQTTTESTEAAVKFGWGTPVAAGSDEFNGSGVDLTKWNNYNNIDGHAGNGRRMAAQSIVSGGVLTQTGLSNGDTGYLSSKYRGTFYGRWEARMRTSARDSEYHPVILLWPDTGGDATTDDEVDFAEGGNDTTTMKFFLHYGTPGQHLQTSAAKVIDTTEWHNYAVEWTPTRVNGYIDGVLWFQDTISGHNPDQPMHQAIQLDWFPDGTATTQSWMQVDWTRAYAVNP
jgi:hypothetical protein